MVRHAVALGCGVLGPVLWKALVCHLLSSSGFRTLKTGTPFEQDGSALKPEAYKSIRAAFSVTIGYYLFAQSHCGPPTMLSGPISA